MLPFAGGSAQAYYKLTKAINNIVSIPIVTIEYAGHGTRFRKKLANNFDELVEDAKCQIVKIIEKQLKESDNTSIVLFGHSMGGMVLAHSIAEIYSKYNEIIKGIIFSSCLPPEKLKSRAITFQTDQQLIDYLCMSRSVPTDLANSKEFTQYILPYVKNDFRILDEYNKELCILPKCPIYAIWGSLDYGITQDAMIGWQNYSTVPICWYEAKGTHFYFEENIEQAADIIVDIIIKCKENNDC